MYTASPIYPVYKAEDFNEDEIILIAKNCHEFNRLYCQQIGDFTQKTWEQAEDWQRQSSINGVWFRLNTPTAGFSAQHDAWMEDKVKDGWVYGEVKDAVAKTHPCIVPYDQLPEEQKYKDTLFIQIFEGMADMIYEIKNPKSNEKS